MTADRPKAAKPPASRPGDPAEVPGIDATTPTTERASESARSAKGRGKPVVYDLGADDAADADLDALLRVLEEPGEAASEGDARSEGLGELLDLLGAAAAATEGAAPPVRDRKPRPAPVARGAGKVTGGDEIIARLLAEEGAGRAANGTEAPPERNGDRAADRPVPTPAAIESELVAVKEKQLQEVMERFARLQSDFESYKKRMDREREETRRFAGEQVLLTILPVLDSFERALSHARQQRDLQAFEDGIVLIYKQFQDMLWNAGLRPIEAVGRVFDPRFHEAVVQIEDPTAAPNTVTSEYQKGYTLHDRLLRPARVIVAKGRSAAGREED